MRVNLPLHRTQYEIFNTIKRFRLVVCGRRWGKTWLASIEAIIRASQGARVWWVAPTHSIGMEGFRLVLEFLQPILRAGHAQVWRTAPMRVKLGPIDGPGGEIEWRTAGEGRSLRGAGLDFVVLDEAAFVPIDAWRMALVPALADKRGDALIISTPAGKASWLYKLWQESGERENWARFSMPSWTNRVVFPGGEQDPEIQAMRDLLGPEEFAQEIGARWLDNDPGAVFQGWGRCVEGKDWESPGMGTYVMGIDLARKQDWTVVAVLRVGSPSRLAYMERFQMAWERTTARIKELVQSWRPVKVLVDATGVGDVVLERLKTIGVPAEGFVFTAKSRHMLLDNLRMNISERTIRFPSCASFLQQEIDAFRLDVGPQGVVRYISRAPHDDTVIALALAVWGVRKGGSIDAAKKLWEALGER